MKNDRLIKIKNISNRSLKISIVDEVFELLPDGSIVHEKTVFAVSEVGEKP